jgi:alkylated DNA repair protein (DNA oxidative demethylase)
MDLFDEPPQDVALGDGALLLGAVARRFDGKLLAAVDAAVNVSPLRHMTTPGGHRISVAMTNCG